jgi:polyisoprenyl-teichoic acid--peptidoglycan teichoic acid transferase
MHTASNLEQTITQPRHPVTKRWTPRRIAFLIGIVFLLIIVGFGTRVFLAGSRIFEGNVLGLFGRGPLQTDEYGRSNIIIFGTTEDSEAHRRIGANQHRTDSIMLASIDQQGKTMLLTSVPRDLWVQYGRECTNGSEGKINVLYLCGSNNGRDEDAGAQMLMDAVKEIYGLDVHYYVHVNFAGVETMVDAVGGIEVMIESSDPRGIYDPAIGIQYPNGPITLSGKEALLLSRARDSTGEGYGLAAGNFSREAHQQKIIMALRDKAVRGGTLSNPLTVGRLIDSLGDNVRTNFNTKEIRALAELAHEVNRDRVTTVSLNNPQDPLVIVDRVAGQSVVRPARGLYDYYDIHQFIQNKISEKETDLEA